VPVIADVLAQARGRTARSSSTGPEDIDELIAGRAENLRGREGLSTGPLHRRRDRPVLTLGIPPL